MHPEQSGLVAVAIKDYVVSIGVVLHKPTAPNKVGVSVDPDVRLALVPAKQRNLFVFLVNCEERLGNVIEVSPPSKVLGVLKLNEKVADSIACSVSEFEYLNPIRRDAHRLKALLQDKENDETLEVFAAASVIPLSGIISQNSPDT